jgi:hypothetical protein
MTKTFAVVLHPVAFGCRCTRGNKTRLHSHLGKRFSGDWAINKNRHMFFGQCFTWVTDCYAIKFILSYDGRNPSILRLQMRLMCWDMDIEHRNNIFLMDADTGHVWALTFALTLCSSLTLSRSIRFAKAAHPQLPSHRHPRICCISMAHDCRPRLPAPMPHCLGCIIPRQSATHPRLASNMSQIMPFTLGNISGRAPFMTTAISRCTIMTSPLLQASCQNLIGPCTVLTTATAPRRLQSSACCLKSCSHATLTQMAAPCSRRSAHA